MFLSTLKLESMVASRLNPLKMCQPSVVREFARSMKRHQILYCAPYVKRNKGLSVGIPRLTAEGKGAERLEEYFPFDPYVLRTSRRFVDPLYAAWKPVAVTDEDEDDDSDEDDASSGSDESDDSDAGRGKTARRPSAPIVAAAAAATVAAATMADKRLASHGPTVHAIHVHRKGPVAALRPSTAAAGAISIRGRTPTDDDNDFLPRPASNSSSHAFSVSPLARSLPSAKRTKRM